MQQQATAAGKGEWASRGPSAHVTFAACCLVFFVSVVIFLHNHNSMAYVHSTIVYSMEAPIGWAQSSRTTVRAVTISQNTAGVPVTRAAMTATTTTTTVGTQSAAKHLAGLPQFKRSVASSWLGHYYGLPAHDTAAASRADAVAATADVPLPEGRLEGNTELHAQPQTEAAQQQQSEPDYGAAAAAASDASEDGDYTITEASSDDSAGATETAAGALPDPETHALTATE